MIRRKRLLVLSVGYRYLPSPGQPSENRILLMATSNVPMKGGLLVSDRNRFEINFTNGNTYWRYRNRPTLQRTIAIRSYHASPYASAEFYYNSKYGKWSSTTLYAGCIFPLGKKVELVPYYEHANEHRCKSESANGGVWADSQSVLSAQRKVNAGWSVGRRGDCFLGRLCR